MSASLPISQAPSSPSDAAPATAPAAVPAVSPVADLIDLPTGKELNEVSANRFAASRPVRLIVLAGPVDCGKTTLLTSLYELFQLNSVAGQNFAGSITLPAFEQRCHLARTASENVTSDTQRTVYKGPDPYYLHLRTTAIEPPHTSVDFLFTDVSGEMFEHARNSTAECKELTFLQRATHFLLLLDGEKGVRAERWAMVQNSRTMLQSCIDTKMLPNFCVVNVVWAKQDYFEAAPDADKKEHLAFREEVIRQFRASFEHRVSHLKFSAVAARPKQAPRLGFGNGVPKLLTDWIVHCPQSGKMDLQLRGRAGTRESELFALRHFANVQKP